MVEVRWVARRSPTSPLIPAARPLRRPCHPLARLQQLQLLAFHPLQGQLRGHRIPLVKASIRHIGTGARLSYHSTCSDRSACAAVLQEPEPGEPATLRSTTLLCRWTTQCGQFILRFSLPAASALQFPRRIPCTRLCLPPCWRRCRRAQRLASCWRRHPPPRWCPPARIRSSTIGMRRRLRCTCRTTLSRCQCSCRCHSTRYRRPRWLQHELPVPQAIAPTLAVPISCCPSWIPPTFPPGAAWPLPW